MEKIEKLEEEISEMCTEKNANIVREHAIETLEGKLSQPGLWKLKQRLCPPAKDPHMAKIDEKGNIITAPETLKKLYLDTYVYRLRQREMKNEYLDIYFLKKELWSSRKINLLDKKSTPWKSSDLEEVLKTLKNNKTADPNKMINEIFKEGCIWDDLKEALVDLFNGIKTNQYLNFFLWKTSPQSIKIKAQGWI